MMRDLFLLPWPSLLFRMTVKEPIDVSGDYLKSLHRTVATQCA